MFHHTDCGMQTFTTPQLREKLKASAEQGEASTVAAAADAIRFLEFSDLDEAVKEEVEFVKTHPLIIKETEVTGWVYHVESGKVCHPRHAWLRLSLSAAIVLPSMTS